MLRRANPSRGFAPRLVYSSHHHNCRTASSAAAPKKEGDISDAFASLSGAAQTPLPDRFRQLKLELVRGRERDVEASWRRLLRHLRRENDDMSRLGPGVVPQVSYADLVGSGDGMVGEGGEGVRGIRHEALRETIRKRGVVVVKGVVPEGEARAYKDEVEAYVRTNPWTRAFPAHDPQVYELYWSPPQVKARAHPSLLRVQRALLASLWHVPDSTDAHAAVALTQPLAYADRLRIRRPGDASFALGAHMDGGSVERWEREGYGGLAEATLDGKGHGVYDAVFAGRWEDHDPWDAHRRATAVTNLYNGLGACSAFRAWQGWLSMSATAPGEGTLRVYPLAKAAAAYTLLRPFFRPRRARQSTPGRLGDGDAAVVDDEFLHEDNWEMTTGSDMTSGLQGAVAGCGQEFNDEWHPHLELPRAMVNVPEIRPGDYVAWHCDTIHAVDPVHAGASDSSVLYMPVCPVTEANARYLVRQREAFLAGLPGPDFPGGEGEARHAGRPTEEVLRRWTAEPVASVAEKRGGEGGAAMSAMGLGRIGVPEEERERRVVERANAILGFAEEK